VFFITTGAHPDYHTPDDDPEMINLPGMYRVTGFVHDLVRAVANHPEKLEFREAGPKESSVSGPRMKVTLGFMPDFSATDVEGVRVDLVTKGKAAERGGIRNGDVLTAIDGQKIKNIYDYMYRMSKMRKNQIISVELLRDGKTEILLIQL
jgi:S1-C subfamily serine protease